MQFRDRHSFAEERNQRKENEHFSRMPSWASVKYVRSSTFAEAAFDSGGPTKGNMLYASRLVSGSDCSKGAVARVRLAAASDRMRA